MNRGSVTLVGAGPGDPELLTVRGLRRLRAADVLVYDRLIDPRLLDEVPQWAERIFAGKAAGHHSMHQRCIEALIIDRARAGLQVVRLKGGDPFVFGRGGEEVEALAAAGIPYEVVPGVTSAVAAPASAGIPVTHRDLASAVTFVTGHEDGDKPDASVDWSWLAQGTGTLVILMGLERLRPICERLMEGGRAAGTPAAVISCGTMPNQAAIVSSLAQLADAVRSNGMRSPAVIVVGNVARFPLRLAAASSGALAEAV